MSYRGKVAIEQMATLFVSRKPSLDDYWRGIILFGRNVASYKFALAKSLLELQPVAGQLLKLSDIAPVYSKHLTHHIKNADKQGTSKSSTFLDGCRQYISGEIDQEKLNEITIRYGFNNVIDAFHVVGQEDLPKRFYIDERKNNNGIRITDEFTILLQSQQINNLPKEVEARWRLVETAWELGISRSLVSIEYDSNSEALFSLDNSKRRKSVTGSRDALNGYQNGKCFFCFSDIQIDVSSKSYPDVDHFFPHILKQHGFGGIIDGVWNLVLSCQKCNRGIGGKFESVPTIKLLERLHKRNESLISSHHPLRETLMVQTGESENQRKTFLNDIHSKAWGILIHQWEPAEKDEPCFWVLRQF